MKIRPEAQGISAKLPTVASPPPMAKFTNPTLLVTAEKTSS
jgi:hypothetical protein